MRPDDGFDKLLPISAPREQEHQRECPHEMRSQEEQAVCTGGRSVRLNDLGRLRPEEVPEPPIDCYASRSEVPRSYRSSIVVAC